jgi:methionyl-tRNA formyltransferase
VVGTVALRIVFCGTPAFAVPSLRNLIAQPDFRVEAVITQPDRPRGRGGEVSSSPVKAVAIESDIQIYQPEKIKADPPYEFLRQLAPDVVVIIAYGQIISQRLLDIPRLGWVNVHASLLPKYRGAAPINWAIINGETRTGITTMQVRAGLDTGPILLKCETHIGLAETAPEVAVRLSEMGAPLIVETLRKLDGGEITPQLQDDSKATLAPLLKKEDGRIDWSLPGQAIYNRIRGLQPWPGAFTTFRGKTCHVWGQPVADRGVEAPPGALRTEGHELGVACGSGTLLRLDFVQIEGRKRITAREFASGARLSPTDHFD